MWTTMMRAGIQRTRCRLGHGVYFGELMASEFLAGYGATMLREPQGKDARRMDTARPAGPREVMARGHFSHVAWGHAENWWPHSTCPHFPVTQGQI